jgi:hypothetical protein
VNFKNSYSPFVVLVALIVFKPSPVANLGYLGAKIGDVTLFLLTICAVLLGAKRGKIIVSKPCVTLIILLCFTFLEIQSAIIGQISEINTSTADTVQFLAWILLLPMCLLGYSFRAQRQEAIWKRVILIVVIFQVFSWILFSNIGGIEGLTSQIYDLGKSRGMENSASHLGLFRLASTFGNPNYFGFICAFSAGFSLYAFLSFAKNRMVFFAIAISSVGLVIVSGSRTSLASLIAVSLFAIIWAVADVKKVVRHVEISMLAIFSVFLLATPKNLLSLLDDFKRFTDVDNMNASWNARTEVWGNLESLNTSFYTLLFGLGSHEQHTGNLDSLFVSTLYKNGMVGLLLIFILLSWAVYVGYRLSSRPRLTSDVKLGRAIQIFTIVILVTSISAQPLAHFQVASLYILLLSVCEIRMGNLRVKGYSR